MGVFSLIFLISFCAIGVFSFSSINSVRHPFKRFGTNKIDNSVIKGDLKPLSNNLLIKLKEAPSKTAGGLFIPDNAKERATEGVVVAVGPGKVHHETGVQLKLSVKVGDSVLYGKYDGTELKYNDAPHQIIKDDDVLLSFSGSEKTLNGVQCVKDHVLVRPSPKESKTSSGIITSVQGGAERSLEDGVVVKVGPGRLSSSGSLIDTQLEQGDSVRFRAYGSSKVRIDGEEFVVVRAQDVLLKW